MLWTIQQPMSSETAMFRFETIPNANVFSEAYLMQFIRNMLKKHGWLYGYNLMIYHIGELFIYHVSQSISFLNNYVGIWPFMSCHGTMVSACKTHRPLHEIFNIEEL